MAERKHALLRYPGLVSLLLIGCALPFVLGSFCLTARTLWFKFTATRVEAVVVERPSDSLAITVEYTAPNGLPMRIQSAGSALYDEHKVGQPLAVYFNPKRPAQARIDHFVENWLLALILLVPTMMLLSGAWVFRTHRTARPRGGGVAVQARFVRVRVAIDIDHRQRNAHGLGRIAIREDDDGVCHLTHNGVSRDPHDPAVQAELGLCNLVVAEWTDTQTGKTYRFESEPLERDPRGQLEGRTLTVYIDPRRPERYRVVLPAGIAPDIDEPADTFHGNA